MFVDFPDDPVAKVIEEICGSVLLKELGSSRFPYRGLGDHFADPVLPGGFTSRVSGPEALASPCWVTRWGELSRIVFISSTQNVIYFCK